MTSRDAVIGFRSRATAAEFFNGLLNVDPQRIYFSGYSAGGGAAVFLASTWPHRVAAVYSMGRTAHAVPQAPEASMASFALIPGFFVVGLNDTAERIEGYREMDAFFKREGYTGSFNFVKNRGHEYIAETVKPAVEFLMKHRRIAYSMAFRRVVCRFRDNLEAVPVTNRLYWVHALRWFHSDAVIATRIEGNSISVDSEGLEEGAVLLNDELVDLDQPVTLRVNGREVFSGMVERSPSFLLDWFDRQRDRGELYWNSVPFKL